MKSLIVVNIVIVLLYIVILANLTLADGKYKNNQHYIIDDLMNSEILKIFIV